jgi:hypothetical protein
MESSLLDTERELLRRCVRRPAARVLRDGAVLVVTPNMASGA